MSFFLNKLFDQIYIISMSNQNQLKNGLNVDEREGREIL